MTRKHFEAIAEVLRVNKPSKGSQTVWNNIVDDMAANLKMTNARFDKQRFIDACTG